MSTVRRLGAYSIEQIRPDVFAIDDDQMESMYLIRGKDKALLYFWVYVLTPTHPLIFHSQEKEPNCKSFDTFYIENM